MAIAEMALTDAGAKIILCSRSPGDACSAAFTKGIVASPFARRITYATTADLAQPGLASPEESALPFSAGSQHARAVEVSWGDEFTQFLGRQSALVASIFADSQGFLDVPGLALFQGSQSLNVTLNCNADYTPECSFVHDLWEVGG